MLTCSHYHAGIMTRKEVRELGALTRLAFSHLNSVRALFSEIKMHEELSIHVVINRFCVRSQPTDVSVFFLVLYHPQHNQKAGWNVE